MRVDRVILFLFQILESGHPLTLVIALCHVSVLSLASKSAIFLVFNKVVKCLKMIGAILSKSQKKNKSVKPLNVSLCGEPPNGLRYFMLNYMML